MPDHKHESATQHGSAFVDKNRNFWNEVADTYSAEQWQKDLLAKVAEFIHDNISWIGVPFTDSKSSTDTQVRVLDYACGPGTITDALGTRATEYIGIDLTPNMVKVYNTRFTSANADPKLNARAVVGNLLDDEAMEALSGPELWGFDLAVVGLGFHHFEDIGLAAKRLVERLKPGGVLLIVDFLSHAKQDGPAAHTVAHHGFSEEGISRLFEEAGLSDVDVVTSDGEVFIRDKSRTLFLAKGRKAS